MSKAGSLNRIELYKKSGNDELLAKEEAFFKANYSEEEPEEPEEETKETKKVKKSK